MDVDRALGSCEQESPVILVAHQPKAAKAALQSQYRLDLVLSGNYQHLIVLSSTVKSFIFLGMKFRGFPNLDIFVGTNFLGFGHFLLKYAFRGDLKFVV